MKCPLCGSVSIQKRNVGAKVSAAIGGVAGGLAGAAGASEGATAGAAFGTALCPGLGTVAGGILGFLAGSVAGMALGAGVGEQVDEHVLDRYQCTQCGADVWIWINEDTVVLSQQGSAGNWQLLCFLVLIAYWPDGIQFLLPYLFHLIRHLLLVTTCILKRNIASFSRR